MSFKIIRNAPPPPEVETRGRKTPHPGTSSYNRYPWDELKIGDAFDVPFTCPQLSAMRQPEYNRLSATISSRHKRRPERFLVRMMGEKFCRCWRVA